MPNHGLDFQIRKRRLLAGIAMGLMGMVVGVATARMFVHFAQPQLNPGPLWLPFVVRIPLATVLAWGTYRLLTIQAESYWHRMTTQDTVRNACQMLLNAAQVHESPQARVQIEEAVSRIQCVLSADPATKRANARSEQEDEYAAKAG
jgi:hypothetical protein